MNCNAEIFANYKYETEHQFWFMSRVLAADSAITTHSIFYDSARLFLVLTSLYTPRIVLGIPMGLTISVRKWKL